ncbi:MAG: CocE/NonD family hydrolase [Gemmatimonadota bacterium]|nr:CocE/NonD family hydrolase [Gemmatimonadota bacterium]
MMRKVTALLAVLAAALLLAPAAPAQQDTSFGVIERNVAVPMRDGVVLRADVWRPEGPGPFPTLVYRTPYSKAPVFHTYGMFGKAVRRGYAVVAQDVRGRYASDGEYLAYQQEGKDGYDTIEWAAAQRWSNGSVGTFGLSYPGAVQWLAAVENPPHLKAMAPAMTFASPTHFWYVGGVWDNSWILWVWTNIAPDLRARRNLPGPKTGAEARAAWQAGGSELQFQLPLAAMPAFRGVADWYYDWMAHPPGDPWWNWAELTDKYSRTGAAVLNLSGWHDEAYGPSGATTNFAGLVAARGGGARAARTRVVVGPWTHGIGPIGRTRSGDREMGPNAAQDYDELVLRWMDRWVRGIENGVEREPPVRVYLMGADTWIEADRWPLPGTVKQTLYLGRTAAGAGVLADAPAAAGAASSVTVSDPAHPVRDPFAAESGPHDYRSLAGRPDVLVFETAPLEHDLDVAGAVEAEIHLSVDAPDTDLWVKLYDVAPDGTAYNLMSPGLDVMRASYRDGGPERKLLVPGEPVVLRFSQLLTANRFRAGHRLRVALMTSFAPHFSRNLHTGALEMESAEGRVARVTIHHDRSHPSRLILPVVGPR